MKVTITGGMSHISIPSILDYFFKNYKIQAVIIFSKVSSEMSMAFQEASLTSLTSSRWSMYLSHSRPYPALLCLSHGQAQVEGGFSINKEIAGLNFCQDNIIARRAIEDHWMWRLVQESLHLPLMPKIGKCISFRFECCV